jgi:hypothetical protein
MANEDITQPRSFDMDFELITGSPVVRIVGHITNEFGEPTFKLTRVITAAGQSYDVEGEHGEHATSIHDCLCVGGCKGQMSLPDNYRCKRSSANGRAGE